MNFKKLAGLLLFSFCSLLAMGQQNTDTEPLKTKILEMCKDSAFDKTIDYLQEQEYFIVSVDKQAGFIQAKKYFPSKKLLSFRAGERVFLNFFIRPLSAGNSRLTLNIYNENVYSRGTGADNFSYSEEKGICKDAKQYQNILEGLQKSLSGD